MDFAINVKVGNKYVMDFGTGCRIHGDAKCRLLTLTFSPESVNAYEFCQ